MKQSSIARIIPVVLIVVGLIWLGVWLSSDAARDITLRLPGGDNRPATTEADDEPIKLVGHLIKSDGVPSDLPGAWPRFRGANFDAISMEEVGLSRQWPENGPGVLWSVKIGEGYAGAAVLNGRVYVIEYDKENKADVIMCLSLDDGREIWRYSYPVKLQNWHHMSRTVPAVTDKYIVTIGPKCHVTCLDSKTGEFKWMYNLVKEFKTTVPQWYTAQCPLIDDGKAIIAPAGDVLMMAVDCNSGEIAWQTPNPDGYVMTHSSIVPMEFKGKRFYVYCGGNHTSGGVVGVSVLDGSVLWKRDWKVRYKIPMPVVVGEDRIFLSAGYGQYEVGCEMLRLIESEGEINVESEFKHSTEIFGSIHQSPIFYEDYIYGVGLDGQLVCLDLEGEIVWKSTSAHKFGSGPYTIAEGLIYIMDDRGVLRLVEASSTGYVQLSEAKVLDGRESWGPMAIASGRLIVRNVETMKCLDITANEP